MSALRVGIAGVRDWARAEAPPPVDPADSLRVLEILEAARRSSETRAVLTNRAYAFNAAGLGIEGRLGFSCEALQRGT